jgi:hypothetical protein
VKSKVSAINKQYKHSPEVRAYLAKCKRDYRAKQKQKAKASAKGDASAPANYQPTADLRSEVTSNNE